MTAWEVRGGQRKVRLDSSGRGEVTFTVTNPTEEQDRAVFEVLSPDGDPAWFEVEEPERLVLPGWTAAYQVRIAVPPGSASNGCRLVGRARSADASAENADSWVTSEPVQVGGRSRPGRRLLVPLIVAAVVVLLAGVGVGAWLLLRSGDVEMPSLAGHSESSARRELSELGLEVGSVRHRHDPEANEGEISAQRPEPGTEVGAGTTVNLQIAIRLDEPTLISPEDGDAVRGRQFPHLEWSPVSDAHGYRVTVQREWCIRTIGGKDCTWMTDPVDITGTTSARPTLPRDNEDAYSGRVRWQVAALDDFGEAGPSSRQFTFRQR